MAARAVWRPPWAAWALLGVAVLVLVHVKAPARLEGGWMALTPVLVCVGILTARRLWELPIALMMCIAVGLAMFSGGWKLIGLGGLPLDRLALLGVLLGVFLRSPGVIGTPRLRVRNVHLMLGVTALYVLGSAAAAGTLTKETNAFALFDQLGLAPYLVFLVAPSIFADRRGRDMLLVTLVGIGAYLGFIASFSPATSSMSTRACPKHVPAVRSRAPWPRALPHSLARWLRRSLSSNGVDSAEAM
jgi:hypothetical protein